MKITRLLIGSVMVLAASCWGVAAPALRASYAYVVSARQLLTTLPGVAAALFKVTVEKWRSLSAMGDVGPDIRGLQALSNHFVQFGAPLDVSYARKAC